MYEKIAARKSVPQLYEERLIVSTFLCPRFLRFIISTWLQSENILTASDVSSVRGSYKAHLEAELAKVASYVPPPLTFQAEWAGMVWPASEEAKHDPETGVDRAVLERVGRASIAVPEGFVSYIPGQRYPSIVLNFQWS